MAPVLVTIIKGFIARRIKKAMFKKLRNRIANSKVLKGKLTYASAALVVAPVMSLVLGFEVAPEEITNIILGITTSVGGIGILIGRWRATNSGE